MAPVASGCRVSLLEPLQAAFEAQKPGFADGIWLQHNHTPGPELLHVPHTPNYSQHPLSGEPEVPEAIIYIFYILEFVFQPNSTSKTSLQKVRVLSY